MAYDYSKLRGLIVEKFGTQQEFAKALGSSETAVSRKLTGEYEFGQEEIEKWCETLDIKKKNIPIYFFVQVVK